MLKNSIIVAVLVTTLLVATSEQQGIDVTFCNPDNPAPNPKNYKMPNPGLEVIYQADIEKNSAVEKSTTELREFYDGKRNIGVTQYANLGTRINILSDYNTNELILIKVPENICTVMKINDGPASSITGFFRVKLNETSNHIASPLTYLLSLPVTKFTYQGESTVRGIPVRLWQTCEVDPRDKDTTLKITAAFSDDSKWTPAYPAENFPSIPVEYRVEFKNKRNIAGNIYEEVNSITRFRAGVTMPEETYDTPVGVFCEGRSAGKPAPAFPKSFSTWVRVSVPSDDKGLTGVMQTYRLEMDYDRQLFRVDSYYINDRFIQVYDYNTGLIYTLNPSAESCQTATLDPKAFMTTFDPKHIFNLGSDPIQYIGMQRTRGINTDVWVSQRKDSDLVTTTLEWSFSTDSWVIQEQNGYRKNDPISLVVTTENRTSDKIEKSSSIVQFSNFEQTRINLYDFDVSLCDNLNRVKSKHLRFSIKSTDKFDLIRDNDIFFKYGVTNAILFNTQISLIRLSRVETVYDSGIVYVTFTMFDTPSFYGVNNPKPEKSLDEAYKSLKAAVDNKLFISFNATDKNYAVQVDPESFIEMDEREGRFVFVDRNTNEIIGFGGGAVSAFIIIFLALGLIGGFASGYFLIIKRTAPINLPGPLSFFNPNFKSEA